MEDEEMMLKLDRMIESIIACAEASTCLAQSINSLVESNQRLVMVLAEGMTDEDETPSAYYMDGTPK